MSDLLKTIVVLILFACQFGLLTAVMMRSWMKDFIHALINRETVERYPNKKERWFNYFMLVATVIAWFVFLMTVISVFFGIVLVLYLHFKYGIPV